MVTAANVDTLRHSAPATVVNDHGSTVEKICPFVIVRIVYHGRPFRVELWYTQSNDTLEMQQRIIKSTKTIYKFCNFKSTEHLKTFFEDIPDL